MSQLQPHPAALDLSDLTPEQAALLPTATRRVAAQRGQNESDRDHGGTGHEDAHADADGAVVAHPVPLWILFATFGALMVLTILTVVVTYFDFGNFNVLVAMLIAAAKAALVAVVFMHLRWDNPFNAVALIASIFILAIFVAVVYMDSKTYDVFKDNPAGNVEQANE